MSTAVDLPTPSFRAYHEETLARPGADAPANLPADYTRTLRPLGIRLAETGETYTYRVDAAGSGLQVDAGDAGADTLVELAHESWAHLTQDLESAPGLIYGGRVRGLRGDLMQLLQWEPALRWLYCGRPVYDPANVDLRDREGRPLDPTRSFTLDDDPEEMAHFLRTVGYLWVRGVLSPDEVATLQAEGEKLRADAREGDQESWWGKRADGTSVLCRVLRAGKQPKMRSLHGDPRLHRIVALCDTPMKQEQGPEDKDGVTILWKQPGVAEGLGDLPWHRDCGMGGHASMCPTAVMSVFLGPNTPEAGAISFLPGSWQSSFPFAQADTEGAPQGVTPPARPGDVTLHYGDGLHVAPPPSGEAGPFRSCILIGFKNAAGRGHHRGERHYNDVLLGADDGQIPDMRTVARGR